MACFANVSEAISDGPAPLVAVHCDNIVRMDFAAQATARQPKTCPLMATMLGSAVIDSGQ